MTARTETIERARREVGEAAARHLMACDVAADSGTPGPAIGPYCGCTDCEIREVVDVAWPLILRHAAELLGQYGQEQAAGILAAEANLATQEPLGGAGWR